MPKVGQPVQFFACEGADAQAATIINVDDADCVCLVAYCRKTNAYVEHIRVPKLGGKHDGGGSTPYWICLDEAQDES